MDTFYYLVTLWSVGQMVHHGRFLLFGDNMVGIFEGRKLECLVATVQISGSRCFPLFMENVIPTARKVIIQEDVWGCT